MTRDEALQFIADQPCEERVEGSSDDCACSETGACLTEYCHPCLARVVLAQTIPK